MAAGRSAPIRHSVTVRLPASAAFELFTQRIGDWWPLDEYSRAVNEPQYQGLRATGLELDPRPGGGLRERLSDGRVLAWGEITSWDPPRRVAMAWRPHDLPEPPTELEVTFGAHADGTRIDVVHGGWERLSDGFREQLYEVYVRGWVRTLGLFAAAAR